MVYDDFDVELSSMVLLFMMVLLLPVHCCDGIVIIKLTFCICGNLLETLENYHYDALLI